MRRRALVHHVAPFGVSVAAAVLAIALSLLIIALSGRSAGAALSALWDGSFGGRGRAAGTLSKMIPLTLVALGWVVAFSAKRVNIGFEGQILVGGVVAATIGLFAKALPAPVHLTVAVVGGTVAGGVYAGVAAYLWARRGVNEIISTLMLNFVAVQLVSWLVRGPLQEPTRTFPRSSPIPAAARWPLMAANTALSWDFLLMLGVVAAVWVVVSRSSFGLSLRLTGGNEVAARHAGVPTMRVTVLALLLSGALAGFAGSSLLLGGETVSMSDNFSAGYGFSGIAVALLARNSPAGVLPAALLLAALRQAGGLLETRVGISSAVVLITQGIVIVLVAGAGFLFERMRAVRVDVRGPRSARMVAAPGSGGGA